MDNTVTADHQSLRAPANTFTNNGCSFIIVPIAALVSMWGQLFAFVLLGAETMSCITATSDPGNAAAFCHSNEIRHIITDLPPAHSRNSGNWSSHVNSYYWKLDQVIDFKTRLHAHLRQVRLLPVPLQSSVIVPVEEVRLGSSRSHVRVNSNKLENSSGPAFFHTDYDGIWQLFISKL